MSKGTVNKVILLGRLASKPEIKYTSLGTAITNISLATNYTYKDNSGKNIEQTEWHRLVVIGKRAEILQNYANKGSLLFIEGRIKTNKWKNKDDVEKSTTEIIVNDLQFVGSRNDFIKESNSHIKDMQKINVNDENNMITKEESELPLEKNKIKFNEDDLPF